MKPPRALYVRGANWSVDAVYPMRTCLDFINARGVRTILIHGFANAPDDADRSYGDFRDRLESAIYPNILESATSVWEFHWPGNHPGSGIMDPLTYSARVGPADQSGDKLAELLVELREDETVILVAHSMGCRVALRAIRQLQSLEQGGPAFSRMRESRIGPNVFAFLLAAAVPVESCVLSEDGESEATFDQAVSRAEFGGRRGRTQYIVMYSGRDTVLKHTFSKGQRMHSYSAQAVGLRGRPEPSEPDRWDHRIPTDLRHGEYWGSHFVAGQIVEFLHPGWRRYIRKWSPIPESRELVGRYIARRALDSDSHVRL